MTKDNVTPLPDTFQSIGSAAANVVKGLSVRAAETLEREAAELEARASNKRLCAAEIRKGARK